MAKRRVKSFKGQKETLPIKDRRLLNSFMNNLLLKRDLATTDVKRYQADRNYMIALLGFNTAFRANDLLQLRVIDVKKGYLHIKELKTGKMQHYRMDKRLHKDILDYIERNHLADHDYLFRGQKKKQDGVSYVLPLTREQGYNIMKKNADDVGVVSTFGMHSLRKTFGYFYIKNGGNVITLMKMYNHDEPATTLRYVCWDNDDAEKEVVAGYTLLLQSRNEVELCQENKLTDICIRLPMEQLERLNDEDLSDYELQTETKRSKAMADVSAQIIDNARVQIQAAQFQADYNRETPVLPKMIGIESKK